jgi:phosphatidylglycerophosphate synthase
MSVSPLCKLTFIEPNHITYFRFAVCLFLLLFYAKLSYPQILVVAVLGGLSDFFDGALARSTSRITKLGILLDPLADKFLVLTIIFVLIIRGALEPIYIVLMALMELHLVVIPLLSWVYGKFVRTTSGGLLLLENKEKDTSLVKTRPVFVGRVKLNLYIGAVSSIILAKAFDSLSLLRVGNVLLMIGIGVGAIAFAIYVIKWARNPYLIGEAINHTGRKAQGVHRVQT